MADEDPLYVCNDFDEDFGELESQMLRWYKPPSVVQGDLAVVLREWDCREKGCWVGWGLQGFYSEQCKVLRECSLWLVPWKSMQILQAWRQSTTAHMDAACIGPA